MATGKKGNFLDSARQFWDNKGLRFFVIRFVAFLLLIQFIVPNVIKFIARSFGLERLFSANYIYTSMFFLVIAVLFLVYCFPKLKKMDSYRQNWSVTAIFAYFAVVFYAIMFYINYMMNIIYVYMHTDFLIVLSFFFSLMGAISLLLAVFNLRFFSNFKNEVVITGSVGLLFYVLTLIIRDNWHVFSETLVRIAAVILSLFFPVSYALNGDPTLVVQDFSATVGAACSGIDSLSMFVGVFVLLFFMDYNKINFKASPIVFVIGFLGMFLVSVIRITTLFYVGTFNPPLAMGLFHENLGWVFFLVYFFIFMKLLYPVMLKA